MTTIVKRITKGTILTVAELDANVANLNSTKLETTGGTLTGLPVLANQDVDIISPVYPTTKPSLNLDFTRGQLDPRVTFARNSTAAYYDGKSVAKAEENLFKYSQEFGTTPWVVTGASITTTETAPDGTATASLWTLVNQYNSIRTPIANISGLIVGATYTVSLWVKNNIGTNVYTIWLDGAFISLGTITPTSTWTRYSFSFVYPASVTAFNILQDRNTSGFGSVYVWGAQLEQRSTVTAYTPTTTAPITNYIPVLKFAPANVPRFDYDPITGKPLGLLIEEGRTNLITNSSELSSWNQGGASVLISNTIIAPDGTLSGDQLYSYQNNRYRPIAVIAGQIYAFSIYAKKDTSSSFGLELSGGGSGQSFFNFDTLAVGVTSGWFSGMTYTAVGNGWYRVSVLVTATITGTPNFFVYGGAGYGGAGSTFFWGSQLEYVSTLATRTSTIGTGISTATAIILDSGASSVDGTYVGSKLVLGAVSQTITGYMGSTKTATVGTAFSSAPVTNDVYTITPATMTPSGFATSYIPTTTTTAVSRLADQASMVGSNFSSWYNQSAGTLYSESNSLSNVNNMVASLGDNALGVEGIDLRAPFGYGAIYRVNSINNIYTDTSGIINSFYKQAISSTSFSHCYSNNGTSQYTINLGQPSTISRLEIGNRFGSLLLNGHIKNLSYYPKALSQPELQALTS